MNKMIAIKRSLLALVLCAFGTATGAFGQSLSESAERAGHWEFYLLSQYWVVDDVTIPNVTLPTTIIPGGPTATSDLHYSVQDEVSWGLGFAYNFTDQLNIRTEFAVGWPDYELTWNGSRLTGEAYVSTGKVNLDYYFMKGHFTPFVSGGIGYYYIDTGIPSGPPEYWIWWDYWWGVPVVGVSQPTFSETYFTYNAAAGVRWDISPGMVMKLTVASNWYDSKTLEGTTSTLETTLSFGWKW